MTPSEKEALDRLTAHVNAAAENLARLSRLLTERPIEGRAFEKFRDVDYDPLEQAAHNMEAAGRSIAGTLAMLDKTLPAISLETV